MFLCRTGIQLLTGGDVRLNLGLCILVVAPNGDYASYCGMWYGSEAEYALVEPAATDADFRMLGLGKAAVLEGFNGAANWARSNPTSAHPAVLLPDRLPPCSDEYVLEDIGISGNEAQQGENTCDQLIVGVFTVTNIEA